MKALLRILLSGLAALSFVPSAPAAPALAGRPSLMVPPPADP